MGNQNKFKSYEQFSYRHHNLLLITTLSIHKLNLFQFKVLGLARSLQELFCHEIETKTGENLAEN